MQKISRLVNIMGSVVLASGLAACALVPIEKTVPATIQQVANLSEEQLEGTLHFQNGNLDLFDKGDNAPYTGEGRFLPIIDPSILSKNAYVVTYNGKTFGYLISESNKCTVNLRNGNPIGWKC